MRPSTHRARLLCLLLATGAAPARAVDLGDGKLTFGGYGSVGYLRTNGNDFLGGTRQGTYDAAELSLTLGARPSSDVFIAVQLFTTTSPQETSIDWAFGEWRASDALRVRVGKMKLPLGIYNEIHDVGTLRPFFTLPVVIYGPSDISTEAYFGAGVTGGLRAASGWSVSYDVYGGNMTHTVAEPFEALLTPGARVASLEDAPTRGVAGGRVALSTPGDAFTLRVSGFRGSSDEPDVGTVTHGTYGVSLEYLDDELSLRAEGFHAWENRRHDSSAAYVEGGWFVTRRWQLGLRAEGSWTSLDGFRGSSPLLLHREGAVTVNYWFTPQLVVKASLHQIHGNRFALPAGDVVATEVAPSDTRLVVLGTQFTF